jgi:hypothetical protein
MFRRCPALGFFSCFLFLACVRASADPLVAFGLTNTMIGQASVWASEYSLEASELRSNGVDGVSVHLGESEAGAWFRPTTSSLADGYFMVAETYGTLNGARSQLLSRVKGGRASPNLYPLEIDLSPLRPEAVSYEVSYAGGPTRTFMSTQSIVQINWGHNPEPLINPLTILPDGSVGVLIEFQSDATIVFPQLLASQAGTRVFIRAHNPSKTVGTISRVDLTGGGGLYSFSFYDILLGAFNQRHRAYGRGTVFNATPGQLQIQNLQIGTNFTLQIPGVSIQVGRATSVEVQFLPFDISREKTFLTVGASGRSAGNLYQGLGAIIMTNSGTRVEARFEQNLGEGNMADYIVEVRSGGSVVARTTSTNSAPISLPTNAVITALAMQGKTAESLPGGSVRFAQPIPVAGREFTGVQGDEIRFLLPTVESFEELHNVQIFADGLDSVTITNEVVTPPPGAPTLSIARSGPEQVSLWWSDPNKLYVGQGTVFPWFYFENLTNDVTYVEPIASLLVPTTATNGWQLFRLQYQPWGGD